MADLAAWMRSVDEQLRKLATAARANITDVRGGFTRWKLAAGNYPSIGIGASLSDPDVGIYVSDDDGSLVGYFGTAGGVGGELRMENDDGSFPVLHTQSGKMYSPLISCAWQINSNVNLDAQGRPTVDSGTYTELWSTYLPITSGGVLSTVDVYPGVGQTADVRIRVSTFGGPGPVTLVEETGISATSSISGSPWTVPTTVVSPAGSPIGRLGTFTIEARRTAGSNPVAVAPRRPLVNWVV